MACPDVNKFVEELRSQEKEPFGKKLHKLNTFAKSVSEFTKGSPQEADKFLESIQPTDFYAKKTRLELANVLRRTGPVINALKSEDKLLINRALQFKWVFNSNESLFQDSNFLTQELFPDVSYSARRKVINRLGKYSLPGDEAKVDKIYEAVEKNYGIDLARNLLPSCSKSLFESVLSEKHIQLSCNQLTQIYKKYPESAIKYLEKIYESIVKSHKGGWRNRRLYSKDSYSPLLKQLIKGNPEEFMKFFEKYNSAIILDLQLGPKMTNHLLKHNKAGVIKDARIYSMFLHQKEIMKRLSKEEYEEFFRSLFPDNIRNFQMGFEIGFEGCRGLGGALYTWLEKYPMKDSEKFKQLEQTFEKVYSKKLMDFPEYVTSRVIQLLPVEERDKWIDLRLSLPDGHNGQFFYQSTGDMPTHREGYWEAFRTTEKSIPKIKRFLATEADVHRRADLVSSLVLTCAINQDKLALVEVGNYVVSRFRNDSAQVRLEFLGSLDHRFDLLKLEDDHWTSINELLQISSINNEFSHRSTLMEHILEKSIQYRLKKDLPVENQVQHYIKMKTRMYCRGESWIIVTSDPSLEKKSLKLFAEHIGVMYPLTTPCPSDSTITSSIVSLCESISGWNRRHPKDLLSSSEFPWLMSRLQEVLESYHEPNKYRVVTALTNDLPARLAFFPRLLKTCPLPPVLNYFLRKEPEKLDEFSTSIIGFLLRTNNLEKWNSFLRKLRGQGFPKLCESLINKCLEVAEDEDESVKERCNSITIMSFLLKSEQFLDWVPKLHPQDPKLDAYSDEAGIVYELRRAVAKCIKNITIPSQGLPGLLNFCRGDYLKLVLGSLYALSYRSASSKVLPFLKKLVDSPVSVKKHAIRLVLTISCKTDNIAFLKALWDSEKNYSIRHIIFKSIFEFFLYDTSEASWDLLKSAIKSLTINDHPFLTELGRTDYVTSACMPIEKLSEYLQVAWETLEGLGDIGDFGDAKWVKVSLLQCITPINISNISEQLLESIFSKYLFVLREDPNLQSSLVQVAVNYLLYFQNSSSDKKVDTVKKFMERLTGPSWIVPCKDSLTMYPAKQALSYFVEQISIESFKSVEESSNKIQLEDIKTIFIALQDGLRGVISDPSEYFSDDLFLSFDIIFHSLKVNKTTDGKELLGIGQKIGKLVDQTIATYKAEIIGIFSETLKRFVSLCFKLRLNEDGGDGGRIIWIIDGIVNSSGSIDTHIVAANLLLTSSSHQPAKVQELEDKYTEVLGKLRTVEDKTVQIFVNYRLTQSRPARGYDILV